jgi:MOSC domain-containing protein YiiM
MTGQVVQVNISAGGLPKRPVTESFITPLGPEGDLHAHPRIHGGPMKAVLVACAESIDALIADGYPLFYGALGENLTVRGIDRRQLRSGQRWRAGDAVIELTTLRVPCDALSMFDLPGRPLSEAIWDELAKAGDPSSPVWAASGFYASVVQTGSVRPGAPFALLEQFA